MCESWEGRGSGGKPPNMHGTPGATAMSFNPCMPFNSQINIVEHMQSSKKLIGTHEISHENK
jgi:hypothetical protein